MISGFNHTGLVVRDMEKAVAFYRDVLGLQVMQEIDSKAPPEGDHTGIPGAHRKLVFLGKPGGEHRLELVYYAEPPSPAGTPLDRHLTGSSHLCFDVEDLEQVYQNLSRQGVRFLTPPKFRHTPDGGRVGICYAQDPEGNWLEFIEHRGGHD
ncbi:MAG: VOC family protein [Nitrospinota bacterium]|nr:MAG: VOC family protein [Nitrospinota bacterium]